MPIFCAVIRFPIFNMLPALNVCLSLAVCFFFAKKHGGDWLMALESAAVFIPCIYMFYNPTAWIYVLVIFLASVLSIVIGTIFKNRFIR